MSSVNNSAPIELILKFSSCIQSRDFKSALFISNEILNYEPNNSLIKQYRPLIQEYLQLEETEIKQELEEFKLIAGPLQADEEYIVVDDSDDEDEEIKEDI